MPTQMFDKLLNTIRPAIQKNDDTHLRPTLEASSTVQVLCQANILTP